MALLFPLFLAILGSCIAALFCWLDRKDRGATALPIILMVEFGVPLFCLSYSGYHWLRFGQWSDGTSVSGVLNWFGSLSLPVGFFFEHASWAGAQHLSDLYLRSNIAWTALAAGFAWFMTLEKAGSAFDARDRAERARAEARESIEMS